MRPVGRIAADVGWVLGGRSEIRGIYEARLDLRNEAHALIGVDTITQPRKIVELHYALVRAMPREEVAKVYFFDSEIEPMHRLIRRVRPNLAFRMRLLTSTTDSTDGRVLVRPVSTRAIEAALKI